MTLKGIPESERNSAWHKRHEHRLMKTKDRQKRGHIIKGRVAPAQAEAQYKAARDRERQKKAPPLVSRWLARFKVWFRNLTPVWWAIKVLKSYQEKQYRGTK